jgi:hypothetical protein
MTRLFCVVLMIAAFCSSGCGDGRGPVPGQKPAVLTQEQKDHMEESGIPSGKSINAIEKPSLPK